MAAAVSIARWLLSEASSGQTPTTCADDTGNSNTLTIDYATADANWTSIAAGNGLDFVAASGTGANAKAALANISANGNIGSSLASATEASLIIRGDFTGYSGGARAFFIGTTSGNGDFAITIDTANLMIRWDREVSSTDAFVIYPLTSGLTTVGVSVDTTEATGADRCKVYYDGVLQTASSGAVLGSSKALTGINDTANSCVIGNRNNGDRGMQGPVYYCELFTGVLTATQHSDAHTALASNNDVNWVGGSQSVIPIMLNLTEPQTGGMAL